MHTIYPNQLNRCEFKFKRIEKIDRPFKRKSKKEVALIVETVISQHIGVGIDIWGRKNGTMDYSLCKLMFVYLCRKYTRGNVITFRELSEYMPHKYSHSTLITRLEDAENIMAMKPRNNIYKNFKECEMQVIINLQK